MRAGTLKKTLDLIALLERHPRLRFGALHDALGVSEPTLSAMLRLLVDDGLLSKGPDGYALGSRVLTLASALLDRMDVRRLARPRLAELRARTGQTSELLVPDGAGALVVDQVEGDRPMGLFAQVGRRLWNLNGSGSAQVVLAWRDEPTRRAFYRSEGCYAATPRTLTDPDALEARCRMIRRRRSLLEVDEGRQGVLRAAGAILDHRAELTGAIALVAPTAETAPDQRRRYEQWVRQAAAELSAELGHAKAPAP
jgi:DNA-binding IclR family transcriptional regulator